MSEDSPILAGRHGPVAVLRLHRPDRLNAVSLPLYRALVEELDRVESDASLRAVVLTGEGRAFCAGADLKAHAGPDPGPEGRREYVEAGQAANRRLQSLGKPVVAAVNGAAVGAGLELALSCDFVVVAREARLRLPEIALGTFVGGGVVYTLPARVGIAKAKELLMLGDFVTGEEAGRIGLADRVVPAESVLETALELAERLARHAPVPMALLKALLDRAGRLEPEEALRQEAAALLRCMGTKDWREGMAAFRDKRAPDYVGE